MIQFFYKSRVKNEYAKPNDLFSAEQNCKNIDADRYYFVAKCLKSLKLEEEQGHLEIRAFPEITKRNLSKFKMHIVVLACIFAYTLILAHQFSLREFKQFPIPTHILGINKIWELMFPTYLPLIDQINQDTLKSIPIPKSNANDTILVSLLQTKTNIDHSVHGTNMVKNAVLKQNLPLLKKANTL